MARPEHRGEVIRWAFLRYHAGAITWADLARTIRQFRRTR